MTIDDAYHEVAGLGVRLDGYSSDQGYEPLHDALLRVRDGMQRATDLGVNALKMTGTLTQRAQIKKAQAQVHGQDDQRKVLLVEADGLFDEAKQWRDLMVAVRLQISNLNATARDIKLYAQMLDANLRASGPDGTPRRPQVRPLAAESLLASPTESIDDVLRS